MRLLSLAACAALLLSAGMATPAAAQGGATVNVYTVNFVCGYQASADGTQGYEPLVKVANYATKIDVNHFGNAQVLIGGRVFDTTNSPWPNNVGGTGLAPNTMPPRTASVINCDTILQSIGGGTGNKPFFSGMVTIRSEDPLIVWATKTTQVCAGTAAWANNPGPVYPYQPLFIDSNVSSGVYFTLYPQSAGPSSQTYVDWTTFGCPSAAVDPQGNIIFQQPGGAVPPNSRTPSDLIPIGPIFGPTAPGYPDGQPEAGTLSISHSMDFERVEGETLELPEGVQPPGCI